MSIAALAGPSPAAAQQASTSPIAPATGYTVFIRGLPLGRESITVVSDSNGTTIRSESRLSAPLNLTVRQAEFKYRSDWSPESFALEANSNGGEIVMRTSFTADTASTRGTQLGRPVSVTHTVTPQALVHANGVFGSYAALGGRLARASPGTTLRVYVVPQIEISARVTAIRPERMQIGTSFLDVRRYELIYTNPGGEIATNLTFAEDGTLVRVNIPAQALDVVREDVAASTSRTQISSNPGDEAVVIPAVGFNLGATLTRPSRAGGAGTPAAPGVSARLATVILVGGSGANDRDGMALGVPTLAHLAGALAGSGFLAVRYDKRGFGQSGGRAESATLSDYAEDVRSVVRWLVARKDVDAKRIAVVGHSEGAWVGLLAASREKRIAALVSIAAPGTTGEELILEQQQLELAQTDMLQADKDARVALQKQIHSAVLTGKGWENVPRDLRREADTPWFQSMLAFNPAKTIDDVRQPLLFVHGALDRQVPVAHVDKLADLARKEGASKSVEVVIVRGVNHLLVPAITGEVNEYATLTDRTVSADVTTAINSWLAKTFAAIR